MAELFVHDDPLDELCVLQLAPDLSFHFDELEVHVFPLHVCYGEDGVDGDLCHLSVAPIDPEQQQKKRNRSGVYTNTVPRARKASVHPRVSLHFGSERGHGGLYQGFCIVGVHGETVADLIQVLDGDAGGLVVAIGDSDGVDAPVQELLRLLQKSSGKDWTQKVDG